MEELFGAGMLGAHWRVEPDLSTGSCTFILDPEPAPPQNGTATSPDATPSKAATGVLCGALETDPKLQW